MIGRAKDKEKKAPAKVGNQKRVIMRLIKEGIFIALLIGVAVAAAIAMQNVADTEKKAADKSETIALGLAGKLQVLQTQIAQLDTALPLTKKIVNDAGESRYRLSREEAKEVFLKLRDKYVLDDIKISISSIEEEEGSLDQPQIKAISSTISINMLAYSDEQVAGYLADVIKELPGIVSVNRLDIRRGEAYSLQSPAPAADQSFNEPKLTVAMELVWYGFKTKPKEKDKS